MHSIPATGNGVFDWTQRPIELFTCGTSKSGASAISDTESGTSGRSRSGFQRPYTGAGIGIGSWTDRPDHDKFYPDAMVPLRDTPVFNITSKRNQSIWVDMYIPKTSPSGIYQGTVAILENGAVTRSIPVVLTVQPFTLPDSPLQRRWSIWMQPISCGVMWLDTTVT